MQCTTVSVNGSLTRYRFGSIIFHRGKCFVSLRTISECGGIHEPKKIRVSRKLKVQEVSDYLCCLPSVYSRYENGKREPSIDILLKLSKLYGVSVDCLIGNDEVVDTSITEKEAAMISAMRQADERARQDAIALLELHTGNKKI